MNVEVRRAVDGDLDAIRHIAVSAFDLEPAQRATLADLLYHRPGHPSLRLVALVDGAVAGFTFGSVPDRKGFVDAIAVADTARHQGVAAELLSEMETSLRAAGATSLGIGGNSWYYAWPGLDIRYTAALSLAERVGYHRSTVVSNMDVDLTRWVPGSAQQALRRQGKDAVVRRADPRDWPELEGFVHEHFGETWRREAERAVHRTVPSAFVATRAERIAGFACHGVYRRDWFGPIGTAPAERGNGLGEALLRRCLDDLAEAGLATAQIGWIGPMSFYSRTVGARCGRQFVVLDKDVSTA